MTFGSETPKRHILNGIITKDARRVSHFRRAFSF